jgi:DNA-binding transcriptional LysR family regulator
LSGLVRLAAGRILAERFLIDRLRAFHERHPAIDLEVFGGSRVVSLAKREADLALRYGLPKDSELVARRMATITFGLYASPSYRDKLTAGHTPAFIGFDEGSDFIAEAKWLARQFGDLRFSFRTSSQTTQAAPLHAPTAQLRRNRPFAGHQVSGKVRPAADLCTADTTSKYRITEPLALRPASGV